MKIKICSKCQKSFHCGSGNPDSGCWCGELPHIGQIDGIHDCLCPTCLKEDILQKIERFVQDYKSGKIDNIAPKYANPKLIEGIDYYVENGLYVFKEWYLLKRGYCCDNSCRHCPYKKISI